MCRLNCELFDVTAQVGVMDTLLEADVDLILGNTLVRGQAVSAPAFTEDLAPNEDVMEKDGTTFSASAPSRSMLRVE